MPEAVLLYPQERLPKWDEKGKWELMVGEGQGTRRRRGRRVRGREAHIARMRV